jgi:hypothetical protein
MRGANITEPIILLDMLRRLIADAVAVAKSYELPNVCVRLGIQQAVEPDDAQEAHASKRLYVRQRILTLEEPALLELAARVLREYPSEDLSDVYSEMALHGEHRVTQPEPARARRVVGYKHHAERDARYRFARCACSLPNA